MGHSRFETLCDARPPPFLRLAPPADADGRRRARASAPNAPAPPTAPETPPFVLVGTIIGENSRIAIFFNGALKTSTGVKEGESDSGWILRSVDPRSATVDGSGRTVTLDLPEPAAQQSPTQESPAPGFKPRFPPPPAVRNQNPAQ